MKKLKEKLSHAFAVNEGEALKPEDLEFLQKVVDIIKRRKMEIPAAFFFHMLTPLNFVSSQALIVLEPLLGPFFKQEDYERIVRILSHRQGMQIFVDKLENIRGKNEQGT